MCGSSPLRSSVESRIRRALPFRGGIADLAPDVSARGSFSSSLVSPPSRWAGLELVVIATLERNLAIVGRSEELDALRTNMRRVADGAGAVVLVEGEAGIGKTRLFREALTFADGLQVWQGSAIEHDDRPLAVVCDATGWVPGARSSTEPVRELRTLVRFRLLEELLGVMEQRVLAGGPALLVLDDLHWADNLALVALAQIARRLRSLPLLVIGAFRPVGATPALNRAVEALIAAGASRLRLRPLDADEVAELATAAVGAPPSDSLSRAVARASGNPLFIVELCRGLSEAGELESVDRRSALRSEDLPTSFLEIIRHRLSSLPCESRNLLRLGALLGSSFSAAELAHTTGGSVVELLAPVHHCLEAGYIEADDDTLTFRHELIREAIYQGIPLGIRRELHRELGLKLISAAGSELRAARHLTIGATPSDTAAVAHLYRAAKVAAEPAVTIELIDRALDLAGSWTTAAIDIPDQDAMLVDKATALVWAGHLAEGQRSRRPPAHLWSRPRPGLAPRGVG